MTGGLKVKGGKPLTKVAFKNGGRKANWQFKGPVKCTDCGLVTFASSLRLCPACYRRFLYNTDKYTHDRERNRSIEQASALKVKRIIVDKKIIYKRDLHFKHGFDAGFMIGFKAGRSAKFLEVN